MDLMGRIPDFNRPIDALEICHENILKRMETLASLARLVATDGPSALSEHVEVWREVFAFIEHNVGNHTRDEDEGLFPMLAGTMAHDIAALDAEHRAVEEIERTLSNEFHGLLGRGGEAPADALRRFAERAQALAAIYRRHIEHENTVVFPAARAALSSEQLAALGAIMRRHRSLANASTA